ncbi:RNA pseudouridine synthase [Vibrio sp. SM6]|uniref:RNA pseudouridine synthase n=1 Tax=Vibrio agarilyticus TaxID=2726741 RepID=A0A7X8TN89_9VIBR|nr:RluA family pseudouridine synthase [Vibrio agarilyticus]NLS11892.1 RNA pseudouridine synthase [Vibrio agarilyticus]
MHTLPNSHSPERLFTRFETSVEAVERPQAFTFPFYYQPHPLSQIAAQELQRRLLQPTQWQHNFGSVAMARNHSDDALQALNQPSNGASDTLAELEPIGKMFGVLVVENIHGELGYLCAFSGKLAEQNWLPGFVPPVYDMLDPNGFFAQESTEINAITETLMRLEQDPTLATVQSTLERERADYHLAEQALRQRIITQRAARKKIRADADPHDKVAFDALMARLGKESVAEKNSLKHLKAAWDEKIHATEQALAIEQQKLSALRSERKHRSNALQHRLFAHYQFHNAQGEIRDLNTLFASTATPTPPAGSGECAAPKLLNYAYQHGLKPIAMAEFWWGASPKSEIRQHGHFYPSCQSKCHPILTFMLKGLTVEPNPLEQAWATDLPLEIVYQDEAMVVVNKPSGLLSVPGKTIQDSAYQRLVDQFPEAEGVFVVHRLDMATSGLLVFALTRRANKQLQKQFITRQAQKRYVAVIEGELHQQHGQIDLPMRGDLYDRPRQLICFEHGKPALTTWERIDCQNGRTAVYLYPHTGRTHQLRVHCAHQLGLNMPIVGDGLYGQRDTRLHLHAEQLSLTHPYHHTPMTFEASADFMSAFATHNKQDDMR